MSAPLLVLFDIDGTLLNTGGVGIGALEKGLRSAFPRETAGDVFPELNLGGATDAGLIPILFSAFQIEESEANAARFFDHYLVELEIRLHSGVEEGSTIALPGAVELVDTFDQEQDCHVGLLTGNIKVGAFLKLKAIGLDRELFPIGSFGCDHADRNKLGPIAIERAESTFGKTFTSENVLIIGDTTKDIDCARACGAKVAAVATGAHDREVLLEKEPDLFFEDFSDYRFAARKMLESFTI